MDHSPTLSLLLIEDDEQCARMVEKVLAPHGYTIHHAKCGLVGLQLARELDIKIILLDMGLPDLDGKVVANQLRGSAVRGKHIPVVAFTAEGGARAKRMALAFGCDDFISKPIDTRLFPQQIANILEAAYGEGISS